MNINGKTQIIGLLGWPVSHSFSPRMHNAAADAAGLNWAYMALPVRPELVETAVCGLPALGFRGVNVTIPHKQAVMPMLDDIEDGAKAIGAVNTIKVDWQDDNIPFLSGYNTDWSGFLADLAELDVPFAGRDCLILGAGGSARAVAYALASQGAKSVMVLSRRLEQAEELVEKIRPFTPNVLHINPLNALQNVVQSTTAPLIVNTTPLGMSPNVESSVWPDELPFPANSFVYDLVYNPPQTNLMTQAQNAGCGAANGLGMLIWQGVKAFEIWTGVSPDVSVMREAVLSG